MLQLSRYCTAVYFLSFKQTALKGALEKSQQAADLSPDLDVQLAGRLLSNGIRNHYSGPLQMRNSKSQGIVIYKKV